MVSSEPSTALVGALKPPVFRYIPSMVMWLRLFVLAIASLQLSSSKLFNVGLFNCGWAVWLFVLAIAGLRLGILELSPGQLT